MTEVVAGLFVRDRKFMICQRSANKKRGLLWEFVGGKVEPGETGEEALARECNEELGININVGEIFCEVVHEYPDITVRLTVFFAEIVGKEPMLLEHNDLKWILAEDIGKYEFCPADVAVLDKIKKELK